MTGHILLLALMAILGYLLGSKRGYRLGSARGWTLGQEALRAREDELAKRRMGRR